MPPRESQHRGPPQRDPNRARAPSPRAAGTVRFAPGGHRVASASSQQVSNAGTQGAAALRAAAAAASALKATQSVQPLRAVSSPTMFAAEADETARAGASMSTAPHSQRTSVWSSDTLVPTPAVNTTAAATTTSTPRIPRAQDMVNGAASSTMPATTVRKPAPAVQRPSATELQASTVPHAQNLVQSASTSTTSASTLRRPAPAVQRPSAVDVQATHTLQQAELYHYQALGWAAKPGAECDAFYRKFPDRIQYLRPARERLVKEATELIAKADERSIREYIETHKDRQWMIDAARKARTQLENDTEEDIKAYCSANTKQRFFVEAARAALPSEKARASVDSGRSVKCPAATQAPAAEKTSSVTQTPAAAKASADAKVPAASRVTEQQPPSSQQQKGSQGTKMATALGMLTASLYDIAGTFLGIHQFKIDAPIQAKMDVTAQSEGFGPQQLIEGLEALANAMKYRNPALPGARLADDGIWEVYDC